MNQYWLTADEVASYLNITVRVVHINANAGKYGEAKFENGRRLIPLSGLPSAIQLAYFRDHEITQKVTTEDDGWDQEPEWKRKIASERLNIITAWDKFISIHPDQNQIKLNEEFVRSWTVVNPDNKFSVKTLYRWRKDYRAGGRVALLPGWGDHKKDHDIDPKAWEMFLKMYLTLQQRSVADCYADLEVIASEKHWRIPSLRTVQRMAGEIPEATLILYREGQEAFHNKCEPYILRDRESVMGNQVWVGDHQERDLFCVGPNGKPVRPWLTSWIDFRSTKLIGWTISFSPNTDTIMAAFANGALNKAIGLPNDIYIDNGRDYSSHEFAGRGNRHQAVIEEGRVRSLVVELGITPHFAIPKEARSKIIERFHKICADRFDKRFPTYCGSNTVNRPEGLQELLRNHPEKIPTLQEIQQAFSDWVIHVYNKLPSEGTGRKGECPDETFARTRGPIRIASEAALRLCLMRHSQPLTIGRNGVQLLGQWYLNADLVAERLGQQVYLRYRDEDMSRVFVFSLKDEYIGEAQIKQQLPVFGADKNDMRQARHERKRVKKIAKEYYQVSAEIEAEPDDLKRVIARKKALAPPDPDVPNVVEPVRVSKDLNDASKIILKSILETDRQIAVGGGYAQTIEQQRLIKLERDRETMQAIRRGMSKI